MHVGDSEQLHFKPLFVTLKVEPAGTDKYGVHREARNKVSGYSAAKAGSTSVAPSQAAPPPRPATTPVPATRPGTGSTPPWRRV
jgi:hypothetical protein